MVRLLSIISLILALVLFPPAVLAVVSNNAVPGDSTYPIKRGLENIIYAVASLNPTTQAWFAKARSDRRFQEIVVLTSQGKGVSNSLNELVEQTKVAANKINNVADISQKEQLISQLSESIAKYDAGLSQISQKTPEPAAPISTPTFTVVVPKPTEIPQISPTPVPSVVTTSPVSTPISTIVPTIAPSLPPVDTSVPTPVLSPAPGGNGDIEKVRDELDKIRKKLEEERQSQSKKEDKFNQEEKSKKEQKENKDKKDKSKD